MIAWAISIASLLIGIRTGNGALVIASGLFAIAGSNSVFATAIRAGMYNNNKKKNNNVAE